SPEHASSSASRCDQLSGFQSSGILRLCRRISRQRTCVRAIAKFIALRSLADEGSGLRFISFAGLSATAVGTRQSEPMPVTETKNRPFASLRMTGCALTADLLLFELHHQLFPFGCEQTMLLAERIEQARQPFGFFCADENAKRLFCICDGSLDPWNFFFHKGEPFLHLPQANGIEAADFFFFFPDDWSGYRRSRLLDWSGNDGLNCIRTALLAPQIVLIVSGIDMHMTAFYLEHARSQPVDEVAVMGNKDHGAGELIYGVEQ